MLVAGEVYVAPVHFEGPVPLGLADVLSEGGGAAGATGGAAEIIAASAPDLATLLHSAPDPALA